MKPLLLGTSYLLLVVIWWAAIPRFLRRLHDGRFISTLTNDWAKISRFWRACYVCELPLIVASVLVLLTFPILAVLIYAYLRGEIGSLLFVITIVCWQYVSFLENGTLSANLANEWHKATRFYRIVCLGILAVLIVCTIIFIVIPLITKL